MNSFMRGLLFGVGIGLLVAPMRGEEMRRLLSERIGELRGYLPENEQLSMYTQQVTDRVSQTADSLKGYAQQAASTMKSTANNLSGIAQNAASNVKDTASDVKDTTKQAVNTTKNNMQSS
jgi:gas vesicle protein